MTGAGFETTVPVGVLRRDRNKALLGRAVESRLAFGRPTARTVWVDSPWDLWWVCYRAAMSAATLGLSVTDPNGEACAGCWRQVLGLIVTSSPGRPDINGGECGCLHQWAADMRRPGPGVAWPPLRLQVALVKPGTATRDVRRRLVDTYQVVGVARRQLTKADVSRLYPEAYGAEYVAAQDTYLTSGPVEVLVLVAGTDSPDPTEVKTRIRHQLGVQDVLRNHVHMPDSPGDTLCDIAHLAGPRLLAGLYERYDRDRAGDRLDHYRAVLASGLSVAHRSPPQRD